MTFQAKLVLVGIIGLCIIVVCSIAGCGGVELMPQDDGGAAGAAGGTAGMGADAGAGHDVLAQAGTSGAAGEGGAGGAAAPCVPDACNTCWKGEKMPVVDGTACGASPNCDATDRYYVSSSCVSGTCVETKLDCCQQHGTVGGPTSWACWVPTKCGSGITPIGGCS